MCCQVLTAKNQYRKFETKFPEKELRGHSPNFQIHLSVSDLYPVFPRSICLFCCRKCMDRSWEYINHPPTHECGNWDWGRAIPRKRINKWDFRCSAIQAFKSVQPDSSAIIWRRTSPFLDLLQESFWDFINVLKLVMIYFILIFFLSSRNIPPDWPESSAKSLRNWQKGTDNPFEGNAWQMLWCLYKHIKSLLVSQMTCSMDFPWRHQIQYSPARQSRRRCDGTAHPSSRVRASQQGVERAS